MSDLRDAISADVRRNSKAARLVYQHEPLSFDRIERLRLLTTSAKTEKTSKAEGVQQVAMYLQNHGGHKALCPKSGDCGKSCIVKTGRLGMNGNQALVDRLRLLAHHPEDFARKLYGELMSCHPDSLIRLNGTADLSWEGTWAAAPFHFIEYTKLANRLMKVADLSNVHMLYSWSELSTPTDLRTARKTGSPVAAVFPKEVYLELVEAGHMGCALVADGDSSDLAGTHLQAANPGMLVIHALKQKMVTETGGTQMRATRFGEAYHELLQLVQKGS